MKEGTINFNKSLDFQPKNKVELFGGAKTINSSRTNTKADMKHVQERLGYRSMQITSYLYSHVSQKVKEKNTARYEDYMDDILK